MTSIRLADFGMRDAYQVLLDRAVEVFFADERVTAMFAVGSVGRLQADSSSDLDLLVVVVDEDAMRSLAAEWSSWLSRITPSVYSRLLGGAVVTAVTPTWERFDASIATIASLPTLTSGPATLLFDRADDTPFPGGPTPQATDAVLLRTRVENFLRSFGLIVTDIERGEFTILTWASEFLIQELVELLFISAAVPRRTLKRIQVDLPQADAAMLNGLPRATTTPEGVIATHCAVAAEYLPRARRLLEDLGGEWPVDLELATDAYVRAHLGIGLPASL